MSDQNQNQPSRAQQPVAGAPGHQGTGYASHPLAGTTAGGSTGPDTPPPVVARQVGLSPTSAGIPGHPDTGSASHPLAGATPGASGTIDEGPETERGGSIATHSSSRINEDEGGTGS